jgi:uncharacterized cupredoxin-like copper-binding protein
MPGSPRFALIAFVLVFGLAGVSAATASPSTVTVSLANQPITAQLPDNLGMDMGSSDMSKAVMSIKATPNVVNSGEVSFVATNTSPDFIHEMILIKLSDPGKPLPYLPADSRVDEEAAGHLGEVAELDPGKSGTLTMTLDPGTYMLFCNIPGHYMAGMWTTVTVR